MYITSLDLLKELLRDTLLGILLLDKVKCLEGIGAHKERHLHHRNASQMSMRRVFVGYDSYMGDMTHT